MSVGTAINFIEEKFKNLYNVDIMIKVLTGDDEMN
jgi:hypothetical protein